MQRCVSEFHHALVAADVCVADHIQLSVCAV